MSKSLKKHTVYLTDEIWNRLLVDAERLGQNPSAYIRIAVESFLDFHNGHGANPIRVAELAEFSQLVLDQLMQRQFPELREPILDAVSDRLGKFHGK